MLQRRKWCGRPRPPPVTGWDSVPGMIAQFTQLVVAMLKRDAVI
jgi:hypothetical protein